MFTNNVPTYWLVGKVLTQATGDWKSGVIFGENPKLNADLS